MAAAAGVYLFVFCGDECLSASQEGLWAVADVVCIGGVLSAFYPCRSGFACASFGELVSAAGGSSGGCAVDAGKWFAGGVPDITDPGQPSGTMAKSMLMTFRLQRMTGLPILVSGGQVFQDTGTEAEIAGREFREMGVAEQELFLEDRSRNTVENARLAKEICSAQGWQRPVLLVVALQAPRTAMIFAREGMDCLVYPTHYRCAAQWHFSPVQDLVPSADCLSDSAAALREYLGIAALKLKLQ